MDVLMTGVVFGESPRWRDGRLLVVSSADRVVLRREPDDSMVTHADLAALSTKPWNDIVVDASGNAYVNNIGFDFPGGDVAPGSIALVTPDGHARWVAEGLAFPDGMAVTPDGRTRRPARPGTPTSATGTASGSAKGARSSTR